MHDTFGRNGKSVDRRSKKGLFVTVFSLVFLLSSIGILPAAKSGIRFVTGELSTEVIGAFLSTFQDKISKIRIPDEIVVKETVKGVKYKVTVSGIEINGLNFSDPLNQYRIGFLPDGKIIFRFNLPHTSVSSNLKLKGKEKGGGFFSSFVDSTVRRKYTINLKGFSGALILTVGESEGRIKVLNTSVYQLDFADSRIKLHDENDGLGVSFIDFASGGRLDKFVKSAILDKLKGSDLPQKLAASVKRLIEEKSPTSNRVVVERFGLRAATRLTDFRTGEGLSSSLWEVELDGKEKVDLSQTSEPELRLPQENSMDIFTPFVLIEKLIAALGDGRDLPLTVEKMGFKVSAKPNGIISVGADGELLRVQVPLSIDIKSPIWFGSKKVATSVIFKILPRVKTDKGIVFELKSMEESQETATSGLIKSALGVFGKAISERIQRALADRAVFASTFRVTESLEVRLQEASVLPEGIRCNFLMAAVPQE